MNQKTNPKTQPFIEVLSDRISVKINPADILYIEVYNAICHIHTAAKVIKCYCPLKDIERKLFWAGSNTFLRTHRSFLVNMQHINEVGRDDFILKNGVSIPIRRNEKIAVKQAYSDYFFASVKAEMFSGHEGLRKLKTQTAKLEDKFIAAKLKYLENPDDEGIYNAFYAISKKRMDVNNAIQEMEETLHDVIENMYTQTTGGKLTKRQAEAYQLIERGKFAEAKQILIFDEIVGETRAEEMAKKAAEVAQIQVNELLQLADVNRALRDWRAVDACYKAAVRMEERHLLPKDALYAHVRFLLTQRRHDDALKTAEKLKYYYEGPYDETDAFKKSELYNSLGKIYGATLRYEEAEAAHKTAVKLAEGLPAPVLVKTYRTLSMLYISMTRYDDAEAVTKLALDIMLRHGDEPDDLLASIYGSLGMVYMFTKRFDEALQNNEAALLIYAKMEEAGRIPDKAPQRVTYSNHGCVYFMTEQLAQAEKAYLKAFELSSELILENTEASESAHAQDAINLGDVYIDTKNYARSEELFKLALVICKRRAAKNPDVDEPLLAYTHNIMGVLYKESGNYAVAEKSILAAIEIRQRLSAKNHEAYTPSLVESHQNLAGLYREAGRPDAAAAVEQAMQYLDKTNVTPEGESNLTWIPLTQLSLKNPSPHKHSTTHHQGYYAVVFFIASVRGERKQCGLTPLRNKRKYR